MNNIYTQRTQYTEITQAEASEWFARLKNEYKDPLVQVEFDQWINASESHRQAYEDVKQVYNDFGLVKDEVFNDVADLIDPNLISANTHEQSKQSVSTWYNNMKYGMAASITLVICTLLFVFTKTSPDPISYATTTGELNYFALEDGSKVNLNTNTQISVDYSAERRDITLTSGEIHIGVSPDKARPMMIDTGDVMIKVVGTEFNVSKLGKQVSVSVVEGVVELLYTKPSVPNNAPIRLIANQSISYSSESGFSQIIENSSLISTWKEGFLLYDADALAQVVDDINRYSTKKVLIADPAMRDFQVSGIIQLDNMDTIADTLETLLPVDATENNKGQVLLYRRF
ncbi:FecR family protein [Agaribacter flavus]|uniref:FecR family protein n=1 Tax=Agaribacter flavus TaxID=1902781 RepID=A0ABV7FSD7_9ALTE